MNRKAGYIIAGIMGVAACAGISFATGSIWAGYFSALVVGLIYLIWLDRKVVQNLEMKGQKPILRLLIAVLVITQFFAAYITFDRSQFMQNNLAETRSSIDEGISKMKTQQILLETMRHYYSTPEKNEATLASSFRDVMGDRLQPDGSIDLSEPGVDTDIHFEVEIVSPNEIKVTAGPEIGKGEDPGFINVNSQTGKYQAVATLTPNGIDYEREN